MGAKANPNRRSDIAAALKKAKPDAMLSLEDLAFIWGTTKGPFVTAKKQMVGMPAPVLSGTSHIYPARQALKAMLDFETRNDAAAASRQKKSDAILGTLTRDRHEQAASTAIPVRDLQVLNRMATEIEQRERDQRLYIPAAEVARDVGDVFSELSEFMAGLSNKVDPNGLLDPNLRALIDNNAADALLGWHRKLKDLLDADAVTGDPRGAADRSGKPRARRKRA